MSTTRDARGAPAAVLAVDLNADLGEEVTDDDGLLGVVSSANVACGYHAGGPATMRAVCDGAAARGVAVGAQVSYADREHFGRRALDVPHHVLREQVADQVGQLADAAGAAGTAVRYLKPHGALYHRVLEDPEQAQAVLDGSVLAGAGLPVLTMRGELARLADGLGRATWVEGFPDRGYEDAGDTGDTGDAGARLLPRSHPGALLGTETEIVEQALRLAPAVASLCLHGDSPGAVAHAVAVRRALQDAGWVVRAFVGPDGLSTGSS